MILYRPITRAHKIKVIIKKYREHFDFNPDLKNPQRFSEKIQWLKLNYKDKNASIGADKVAVRGMVSEKVGKKYLVPVVGIFKNSREIDWDSLPNKFVAKINNGCGLNIICLDKNKLNKEDTLSKLDDWMKATRNHYWKNYEWNYKNIKPQIIIEQYIGNNKNQINEYKFMYVGGKLAFIQVPAERDLKDQFNVKLGYYSSEWDQVSISRKGHPSPDKPISKPKKLKEMLKVSEELAKGFILCRVDLYEVGDEIKFGELTFTPGNGIAEYKPDSWDTRLGQLMQLPKRNNYRYLEWRPVDISIKQFLGKIYRRLSGE